MIEPTWQAPHDSGAEQRYKAYDRIMGNISWLLIALVALATKKVLGEDLLAAAGIDWKAYAGLIGQRPSAQKVDADKKADAARMAAAAKAG